MLRAAGLPLRALRDRGVLYHRRLWPQNLSASRTLPPGRKRYYLLLIPSDCLCHKGVVAAPPGLIQEKAFAVFDLRDGRLPLAEALSLGVSCAEISGPLTR